MSESNLLQRTWMRITSTANRLEGSRSARRQLADGSGLSVSDQRLLAGLASAEARILGSAQLGKMRDVAIGLLRVTTLLAAVLLMPVKQDPSEPESQETPPQPQVVVIPVTTGPGSTVSPMEQVTVNLKVEGARMVDGNGISHVEVIDHRPLPLFESGKLVLGASRGYWYRTELGIGDYFWALPDGDFSFRVKDRPPCAEAPSGVCGLLEFQFDTRAGTQARLGRLNLRSGVTQRGREEDQTVGDPGTLTCETVGADVPTLQCEHDAGAEEGSLLVWVRESLVAPNPANGKTAFEVRWCHSSEDGCVLSPGN